MPLIQNDAYRPPFGFKGGNIQTIFPTLFRKVNGVNYRRERISTPDDDFIDLDISSVNSRKAVIISHGLEGNTSRSYVTGMVKYLNAGGYDAVTWNCRGCSGEMNLKPQFYHSGSSYDLETVIQFTAGTNKYNEIALVGFSMGGNITLKYLGEKSDKILPQIKCAIGFSVPCDLQASAYTLSTAAGGIYLKRFLITLKDKIKQKAALMPEEIDISGLNEIKTLQEYDDRFTAPLHGFRDAVDYWNKSSCNPYLENIRVPALIVSAENDPFLTESCYPREIARNHKYLTLETPRFGGHVGFVAFNKSGHYWSEERTLEFIDNHMSA